MPANVNKHVDRLLRFLPFSAAHDQIYEEYQTGDDNLDLETVAINYAAKAISDGAECVILTGDAGHGKTHMCRRFLEAEVLGYEPEAARTLLLNACDGESAIPSADGSPSPTLRVHKDLSEIQPPAKAARFLEEMGSREGQSLVVCANEGRLRAIISSTGAGPVCAKIAKLFKESFQTGTTADAEGKVHIINLNYQSIAASDAHHKGSLLRRVMASWVSNGSRWVVCRTCSHEAICPIRRNRALLDENGTESASRQRQLEEIFEVVERLGHVVTIREMLMLVAYLITGGLGCKDVDKKVPPTGNKKGWQHAWAFYNLLFRPPPDIPEERADKGIPILSVIRRLDPGAIAVRSVDERILNRGDVFPIDELDLQFKLLTGGESLVIDAASRIDEFHGNPQSRADRDREAHALALAVSALRRRAFFDGGGDRGSVMLRLGFRFGDDFLRLLKGTLEPKDKVLVKNRIIAGLHAVQGLRTSGNEPMLQLVDPAFGKASADAAIIAKQIPSTRISLESARSSWNAVEAAQRFLPKSVDWIDRNVFLKIKDGLGKSLHLSLDLLSFECIARAADGYVNEDFYANEIRRVRTFLGQLAETGRDDSAPITIFMRGKPQIVSLDMGVIQVGGE